LEFTGSDDGLIEVVDLEPQHHPVADRLITLAEMGVMVLHVPGVELKHQTVGSPHRMMVLRIVETFVLDSAPPLVTAAVASEGAAEESPVETARRGHITNDDQRLGTHHMKLPAKNGSDSLEEGRCGG